MNASVVVPSESLMAGLWAEPMTLLRLNLCFWLTAIEEVVRSFNELSDEYEVIFTKKGDV